MSSNLLPNLTHRHVAVSPSTNSELLQAVKTGTVDCTQPYLLTASTQTSGRGQHGRTWQSPEGNVYLSLYHPLQIPLSGLLSLVVGYQLTRLPLIQNINRQRKQLNLPPIGVKWANDVGFYAKEHSLDVAQDNMLTFNKLAGILIEPVWVNNQRQGVIVGIGLNVNEAPLLTQTTQEGLSYHAISLRQLIPNTSTNHSTVPLASQLTANELYMPICGAALRAISRFQQFEHTPYSIYQFITDYTQASTLAGHKVIIHQQDQNQPFIESANTTKVIKGDINGINADGSLQLTTEAGEALAIYTGNIKVLST